MKSFTAESNALAALLEVSPVVERCPSGRTTNGSRARLAFVVAALLLANGDLQGQYIERVDVSVANVDVVVTDAKGNPVRGLTREDFEVYEDGKLQTITNFSAIEAQIAEAPVSPTATAETPIASEPPPRRLIIMFLDIDDIEPIRRRQFFEGVATFLDSTFREGDLFTLFTWTRRLQVVAAPTSSRADVEKMMATLARADRWSEAELMKRVAAMRISAAESDATMPGNLGAIDPASEEAFEEFINMEARCAKIKRKANELQNLITSLARVDMQKVVLFASDDFSLRPAKDCSTVDEIENLAAAANAYGMTIHAFHPPGQRERVVGYNVDSKPWGNRLPSANAPTQQSIEANRTFEQSGGIVRLAERTGGLAAIGAGMSASALERAASELDNYYSIGYRFSEGDEDRPRSIKVTTRNKSHRVRTRQSVVRLSEKARLRDELTANLYLPPQHESVSPAFEVRIDRTTRDGRYSLVHLELSIAARDLVVLSNTDDGKKRGSFSVFVVAGRELGDASPVAELNRDFEVAEEPGDSRVTYTFATRVRPDTERLSIAVRDNTSGEVSTKLVSLTAPASKGSS